MYAFENMEQINKRLKINTIQSTCDRKTNQLQIININFIIIILVT